jgi:AbrB family looped-hinge helix DNA binding protein
MAIQRAKLIDGGKVIIPAAMRRAMGIATGDTVVIELDAGEIRIRTLQQGLDRARAIVRRRVPAGRSLVDELIAERRAEAGRD